jgi:hypothetical protein
MGFDSRNLICFAPGAIGEIKSVYTEYGEYAVVVAIYMAQEFGGFGGIAS